MTERTSVLHDFGRRGTAPIALVCLANGGGNAAIFRDWADALAGAATVYAVEYAGRGARSREAPDASLAERVDEVAGAVAAAVGGPFALFGHSLGAMTAAFVVERLESVHGRSCVALLAACAPSPRITADERAKLAWIAALPDARFLTFAAQVTGKPLEVAIRSPAFLPWTRALRHDIQLASQYDLAARPLACQVVAFYADADPMATERDVARWSECTTGGFSLRCVHGDHHSVIAGSQSELLANVAAMLGSGPVFDSQPETRASGAWPAAPTWKEG